jgi:hypothetical protein
MLLERVRTLTGLAGRDAAKVAFEFDDPTAVSPQEIVDKAIELGFDVEKKHGQARVVAATPMPEITMNPAEVLSEVYMTMPRVLMQQVPKVGRVPDEARQYEGIEEILDALPEDVKLLLAKIDVIEGAVTFWLYDVANEIDRAIGPIDLTRYISEDDSPERNNERIEEAFRTLLTRVARVIAADTN